jgi:hypothetical protein
MTKSLYFLTILGISFIVGCGSSGKSTSQIAAHESKEKVVRANWEEVNKPGESSLGVLKKSLDNNLIEINLVKGDQVGEHIQFFIDSDYNEATGYSNDWVDGADYLIEDGRVYKSTANGSGWNWQRTGTAEFDNDNTHVYARTTTEIIEHIKSSFRVAAISSNGNQEWIIVSNILMKPIDRKIITIDANPSDWREIPVKAHSDMGDLKVIDDINNLYFLIEKGNLGQHTQIFLNIDNDVNSGYSSSILDHKSGAEYLIEDNRLYKSTANDGSWSWQKVGSVQYAKEDNLIEISVVKSEVGITNDAASISVGGIAWDASFENDVSNISMQSVSFFDIKGLIINEVMASNAHTIMDPDFYKFSDWIEIHNESAHAIDLSNYKLSDKMSEPQWTIPDGTIIPALAYKIFWADKEDTIKNGYHTNFSLKSKGEEVALFDVHSNIVDGFSFTKQKSDVSITYGMNNDIVYMHPTPNQANSTTYDASSLTAKPIYSASGGFYNATQNIILSAENGAAIYYTTDGSFPTLQSAVYQDAIEIDQTTVIRARALENGKLLSEANTQTYLINENTTLPVVSISTDNRYLFDNQVGIYTIGTNGAPTPGCAAGAQVANFYQDWKRPANIEYFDDNKNLGFSQEFDMKISGSCSRVLAQKSLSIKADSKYGEKSLNYKLFPHKDITKFKGFKIKSAGQDWEGTMLRDAFMQQVIKDSMDVDYQDYRACIVFLNGQYWGIHNIREKKNEDFIAENHPEIDPDKVDILKDNAGVNEGSSDKYNEMITYITDHDLSNDDNYNEVVSKMDIENYIDYIIAETYFANSDWPYTNIRFYRDQNGGKWRWILEDLDIALGGPWDGNIDINMFEMLTETENIDYRNPLWSTFLFRSLLENGGFKSRFKQKYTNFLDNTFETNRVLNILNPMVSNISDEMTRHTNRWKDHSENIYKSKSDWEDNVNHLRTIINGRNQIVRDELIAF